MDFRLDADDTQIASAAAESFTHHFPLRRFRDGANVAAWRGVSADGWTHAALPEAEGGQEMPTYLVSVIAREAGRVLCVDAWTNNAVILPRLIALGRDATQRREWLAHHAQDPGVLVADGRAGRIALAPSGVVRAEWCYGVEPGADAYVLVARDGDTVLRRIAGPTIELRSIAELAPGVGAVTVSDGCEAALEVAVNDATLDAIVREAVLVHSASLVGLAEESERITVAYVKVREQYGAPVGKFQSLKHMLADVHVLNEVAWNACLYASLRPDEAGASEVARLQAIEATMQATKVMLQLHGGIGFTWESDVHFFLKTALTACLRFGGHEGRARELGRSIVEGEWTS